MSVCDTGLQPGSNGKATADAGGSERASNTRHGSAQRKPERETGAVLQQNYLPPPKGFSPDEIAEQVAAFVAGGGVIQVIPVGTMTPDKNGTIHINLTAPRGRPRKKLQPNNIDGLE